MSEARQSPIDEVCRMLDERGVEYETYIEPQTGFEHVKWNFNEYGSADFNLEFGEQWLTMYGTISGPEQAIAATVGRPKVKKVRGMTYDEHGGEVYYLACSGCGEWIDGDLDCITEYDGPNFCHNCGGEFDGPLLCKRCGGLADLEYGDMCAECYEEVGA